MNKIVLTVFLLWPPAYCGGNGGYPLRRSPEIADIQELKEEIASLKQELAEAKAEVTAEDAKHKRTDIKKLMGDQADVDNPETTVDKVSTDMAPMDMVVTCVTVDGVKKDMHCDVPGCKEIAHTMWFSVDTGIMFKRCDKHKDGVVK
jgi:hypothetical protein